MDPEVRKLGSSLPVPLVQELAKEKLATVPLRYVRDDQQAFIVNDLPSSQQIPVIDFGKLSIDSELDLLHAACQNWGFFQLINHGVDPKVVDQMKLEVQHFFNLPVEKKMILAQEPGDLEGYGQAFVVSEEQKLNWSDMFYVHTSPGHFKTTNLFGKLPSAFRDAIKAYATEMEILAMKVFEAMARALHINGEDMKILLEEVQHSLRMNYYPPCPQPELVTGLAPHADGSALTILLQVNKAEGLQIAKDGTWIPVSPLPDAFTINIGDMLEIITNGVYRSINHRATVSADKERLSIATFVYPKLDGDLEPAPSLITRETPARFKRVSVVEFFKGYFSRDLVDKSYLDTMRI